MLITADAFFATKVLHDVKGFDSSGNVVTIQRIETGEQIFSFENLLFENTPINETFLQKDLVVLITKAPFFKIGMSDILEAPFFVLLTVKSFSVKDSQTMIVPEDLPELIRLSSLGLRKLDKFKT